MKNNIVKNIAIGTICCSTLATGICILKNARKNSKVEKVNDDNILERNYTEIPTRGYIKIKEFYK